MKTVYLTNDDLDNFSIQLDFDTVTIFNMSKIVATTVFPTVQMAIESANEVYVSLVNLGFYEFTPNGIMLPAKRRKLNESGEYLMC